LEEYYLILLTDGG